MTMSPGTAGSLVTALVPSLSRSLAEQFNVFRVMHHGTHEKQLSNVFAWLLREDGTHGLGDAFQRIFVGQTVAAGGRDHLPRSGFRVTQEVNTAPENADRDIADIVLTAPGGTIVVENFEASDGHGHDYARYLAFGSASGQPCVVVLLCARHEPYRQSDGWENAVVLTYGDLLAELHSRIATDPGWQRSHPGQHFLIEQLVEHFVEGPAPVSSDDRIAFISTMCATGEADRYGHRPQERAAGEFAAAVAQHARHQFEEGRTTLGEIKRTLRSYAAQTLVPQLDSTLAPASVTSVHARFVGQWEWCVTLELTEPLPKVFLEFGPTAVVENARVPHPIPDPDYAQLFVTRRAPGGEDAGIDLILPTRVGLGEVLAGLAPDDVRLRDAVMRALQQA